jgi:hypothetical protein
VGPDGEHVFISRHPAGDHLRGKPGIFSVLWLLKIKHPCFCCDINDGRRTPEIHIGKKLALVHLTRFGAGNSDACRDFLFHQIGQIIIGTIAGLGPDGQVPAGISPVHAAVDQKKVHLVVFIMGYLGKLKTPGSGFIVVSAENENKAGHWVILLG